MPLRSKPGVLALGLVACLSAAIMPAPAGAEQPVAAEHNPPGDIPDNQVFITYASPDGYAVKTPEGWARSTTAHGVRFADKYDVISLDIAAAVQAPTVKSLEATEIPRLARDGRAVEIRTVGDVDRQAGKAIRIVYRSNSDPNPVTGRQTRLEHERYVFFSHGKQASLDLAAPLGADNADQWLLISNSFRWR